MEMDSKRDANTGPVTQSTMAEVDVKVPFTQQSILSETDLKKASLTPAGVYEASQRGEGWQQAVRSSPKALGWCCYALFTCVMWGYDGLASSVR